MRLLLKLWSRGFDKDQWCSISPGSPPQTLEKLLQKMDEYIRANNDFRQRREEAYRYSKMTRGFGGRLHPRHVRTIHNPSSSEDREVILKASTQLSIIRNTTKFL
jgi:hypothetical protein